MKTHAKRTSRPATPAAPLPAHVRLTLTIDEATHLSEGMADLLCWARGFVAACPAEPERHPMGFERIRQMRESLKRAIHDAEYPTPSMRTEQ